MKEQVESSGADIENDAEQRKYAIETMQRIKDEVAEEEKEIKQKLDEAVKSFLTTAGVDIDNKENEENDGDDGFLKEITKTWEKRIRTTMYRQRELNNRKQVK